MSACGVAIAVLLAAVVVLVIVLAALSREGPRF